ncbi:hypothetical protein QBC46DRAFT_281892 [Diplogelasinospora grovesii]|uniref:Geranylgeranyl transferase type-2 subunit alpha n=1 Tax=Diplogelasinospora grovesii TaxID=303347 RepID=A0AAN6NEH0_9PEZI|nr:hypothetical protein QBC46DRAFT_281892 [Diplogelasinospora grovesii]
MATNGSGTSHGIARTSRARTEEQRHQELEKIRKYRELEDQVRSQAAQKEFGPELFQLTSKLLRLNPEYYTVWNIRRRSLISGLLSRRSDGSSPLTESPISSQTATTQASSAVSSSSSSDATPPSHESQTTGKSGTIAEDSRNVDGEHEHASNKQQDSDATKAAAEKQDLDVLKSELAFTIPLLLESPKCYWIWSYRLWVLEQAIQRLQVPVARRIWQEELGLATKMLTKDRRNFHAWGYRRHVVATLESASLGGESMVEAEFDYTTHKINQDLSNFSAWHNRSKLIPRLLDERGADDMAREALLNQELGLVREGLNVGPDDQSLWYYHQWLMLNLVDHVGKPTIVPHFTLENRVTYFMREIREIKDLLEDYKDVQLIYESLVDYTLSLCQLEERQPNADEKGELVRWLDKLRKLDPMRSGRWTDLERDIGLKKLRQKQTQ